MTDFSEVLEAVRLAIADARAQAKADTEAQVALVRAALAETALAVGEKIAALEVRVAAVDTKVAEAVVDIRARMEKVTEDLWADVAERIEKSAKATLSETHRLVSEVRVEIETGEADQKAARVAEIEALHDTIAEYSTVLEEDIKKTAASVAEAKTTLEEMIERRADHLTTVISVAHEQANEAFYTKIVDDFGDRIGVERAETEARIAEQIDARIVEIRADVSELDVALATVQDAVPTLATAARVAEIEEALGATAEFATMAFVEERLALVNKRADAIGCMLAASPLDSFATKGMLSALAENVFDIEEKTRAAADKAISEEGARVLEAATARIAEAAEPLKERIEAVDAEVSALWDDRTRTTDALGAQIARLESNLSEGIAETQDGFDAKLSEVRAAFETDMRQYHKTMADALVRRYCAPEDWLRGGAGYREHALCRHDGHVWLALRNTTEEPGPRAVDWMPLADGLASITVENPENGQTELVIRTLRGAETRHAFEMPRPRARGVFDPATTYSAWDSVAKDGHIWMSLRNGNTAVPGTDKEAWQLFSGPRGRKGEDARAPEVDVPGIVRKVRDDVLATLVPQLQEFVDAQR